MKRTPLLIIVSMILVLVTNSLFLLIKPEITLVLSLTVVSLGLALILAQQAMQEKKSVARLALEKQATEVKLQEQEGFFKTIFDYTHTGVAILQLDGTLLKINKALCEMLGYSEADLLGINFYQYIYSEDQEKLDAVLRQLIERKNKLYQAEQQCFQKNGDAIWIILRLSLVRDNQDKPVNFIVQIQNITLQKKAEERLRHMAYHDPLTGLANRNKLEQFISHILASARRHQQGFALLFLDLDSFKNINDTIGHDAGDLLLQVIAERLHNSVRSTDMVARLGGDEFVLVITDVKKTEVVALIAQKILDNILKAIMVTGQEIYITTSIGISLYPFDGQNMQTLMKNADLALYRAKEHGRNNYQFYTVEMTSRAREKMDLQNALAHALAKNEFFLHYQPKMELKTQRITGIEALLRWKNKEYGMTTPDEIISLAEETGLIIPVSAWILRTACKQLKQWHQMGFTSLTMAVNCSARQFKQGTFTEEVSQVMTQFDLPARALEIEITETLIMQDPENTLRVLYALKDLGVQIAIDDFGTGYWSLGNLRRLSVDKIKIDKSFIKQVIADETSAAITSAIIAMVNKLGIISIAEGVETKEQYHFLIREGCTEIQGYYITQPLSDEMMTAFLQHPLPVSETVT
ncbi:MAG: EAL domain-containing protein [Gammaproteobacteria bacterium]|nr:MAG: EAL domain-containing protein [Gammaproteobacteria bacterium]